MPRPAPLPAPFTSGPFTTAAARARSVPPHRLRAADLAAPFRGIRTTRAPQTLDDWCAAMKPHLSPHQFFSHATAAALWGLPLPHSAPLPLHVAAVEGREPRMRGVIGHRISSDRVERWTLGGLPVVSAADAWCQLAAHLSHRDLVAAGDGLLAWPHPVATEAQLDAAIARHVGGRGARRMRAARADIRPGSASRRESLLRIDVLARGLPEPECNGTIRLSTGTVVGDLVFRAWRVLLEYDGDHHRTDASQFARDVDRLNALAAEGWIVVRVRSGTETRAALDAVERALRSRGWHPAQ